MSAEWQAYQDIAAERERQDAQWGGPAHDDEHSVSAWPRFLRHQLGRLSEDWQRAYSADELAVYRTRMVKIAALAVAAIEWCDRRIKANAEARVGRQ